MQPGATSLTLDRVPGAAWAPARWTVGDEIVVTTTDYLPDHSEQLTITGISGNVVSFRRSNCDAAKPHAECGVLYRHQGERYPLSARLDKALGADGKPRLTIDPKLQAEGLETRAAVALLTRSITIQSEGDSYRESFAQATARNPRYAFGGHLVIRQGFEKLQVQGVEFKQLGQGGRKGHLSRPLPHGAHRPAGQLGEGFVDQRIDDPLGRGAFDAEPDDRAQRRLSVDRAWFLSRGFDRDRQPLPFQHRHPCARRHRQPGQSPAHSRDPGRQFEDRRQFPVPDRWQSSVGVLDHQQLE